LDEDEAYNLISSLVPKGNVNKDSFDKTYKNADKDKDGNIELAEVTDFLVLMVQGNP